ncbi:MAG: rRNA maturation RNase YbeY [Rhodobacterales bacterium]|nr:rRNA maturation RNase YbeY [Rhodobacterales bacterium]
MQSPADTVIEDDRWQAAGLPAVADRAARAVLARFDLPADGFALCIMGCDDARIAELNGTFRGKGAATNVLSWPSEDRAPVTPGAPPDLPEPGDPDDPAELGDIAIAWDTCAREAAEQGKTFDDHVTHLLVHSVLHLLGYDHIDPADADLMERTEVEILASLGVKDPY